MVGFGGASCTPRAAGVHSIADLNRRGTVLDWLLLGRVKLGGTVDLVFAPDGVNCKNRDHP